MRHGSITDRPETDHLESVHVLLVDDDPDLVALTSTMLEREHSSLTVTTRTDAEDALSALATVAPDCIVSDYNMPGMDGIEFLELVRERHGDIPFILFTGRGSEEVASRAISAGATDYLQKGTGTAQYAVLAKRIQNAVGKARAERRYRQIFEKAADGIVVHDTDTDQIYEVNERFCELVGYDREELLGLGIGSISPDEQPYTAEAARERIQRAATEGPQTFEWINRRRDGSLVPVEVSLQLVEFDGLDRVLAHVRDATDTERRRTELARTRDLLGHTQRAAGVAGWEYDPSTDVLVGTEELASLLGVPLETDLDDRPTGSWFHPDDYDAVRDATVRTYRTGEPFDIEVRLAENDADSGTGDRVVSSGHAADSRQRWVRLRGERSDDDPPVVRGVAQDITDAKNREHDLEQSRRLLRDLVDTVPILVSLKGPDLRYRLVNEPVVEFYGVDRETLLGREATEFHANAEGSLWPADRSVIETGERTTIRDTLVDAAGNERIVSSTKLPFEFEDGTGVLSVSTDITERVEAERDLEENQRLLREIVDGLTPFISLKDRDGRYLLVNQSLASFYGTTPEAAVGKHPHDLLYEAAPGLDRADERVVETGEPVVLDDVVLVSDDEERVYRSRKIPFGLEDGTGVLSLSIDVTAEIRAKRELERQNERLEEFTSVVSHDLRNPLAVVRGGLDLARDDGGEEALAMVERGVTRIERLVDDLLTLARQGRTVGERGPTNLRTVAEDAWATVKTDGATLAVDGELTLAADDTRLQQVFENLFRNSVEHADRDVTVGVRCTDEGFVIEDDGPGIPADVRDRVFDHGYTTSDSGTGFGLAIVREVVEAHGWEIRADESPSGGARFVVTVPANDRLSAA